MNQSGYGAGLLARAVEQAYARGQTDYSLEPLVRADAVGKEGRIKGGDAVIFCCRRGEREIELTEAFTQPAFRGFSREKLQDLAFVILTLYHEKFKDLPVAFMPSRVEKTLAETVSRAGLSQLHIAESEKFAHVTFFFNGGSNAKLQGETDVCVPSLKGVPFEKHPELSLRGVAEGTADGIRKGYDFIVANFANGDVIGHTVDKDAKIACARHVSRHLGQVFRQAAEAGYAVLIAADHGNLEEILTPDGKPHVAHTSNPVNLILAGQKESLGLRDGILADVAPTVLALLGLKKPDQMTGRSLLTGRAEIQKVLLIILDGWGIGSADSNDAIFLGDTPEWDDLLKSKPHSALLASGEAVGLQAGKAGNSEAGHLNLGAGRVVAQDDVRLDQALKEGSFAKNEVFKQAIDRAKEKKAALHLISYLSHKSSHGSIDYPLALTRMAKSQGLENIYLHIIFDGRSTAPGSAPSLLCELETSLASLGAGQVVDGVGRGIALDRDGNYQKIKRAYDMMVHGEGMPYADNSGDN